MTMPSIDPRLSSNDRGYDSSWRKARDAWLSRHPLCEMCRQTGRAVAATVVDHIVPHRIGDALRSKDQAQIAAARARFLDLANWQSLCKTCHDGAKAQQESSGVTRGCDGTGAPLDEGSHWHAGDGARRNKG